MIKLNILRSNVWRHFAFDRIVGRIINKGEDICRLYEMLLFQNNVSVSVVKQWRQCRCYIVV